MLISFSFLLFIILVLAFLENKNSTKNKYELFGCVFLIYLCLIFIAYLKPMGMGYDDYNYYQPLQNAHHPYLKHWESGYVFLNSILRFFTLTEFTYLSVTVMMLSMALNTKVIYKLSPYFFISLLVYVSHLLLYKELTQFRSAIAYSFCMLSFYYLYRKEHIKFFLTISLAVSFHVSAILALIVFFTVRFSLNKLFIVLIGCLILSVFSAFENSILFIGELVLDRNTYGTYVNAKDGFATDLGLLNPVTLKYIFFSMIAVYMCNKRKADDRFIFVTKIYIIAPIWIVVFSSFGTLAGRPATIFSGVECILLAYFCCSKNAFNRSVYKVLVVLYSLLLLYINVFVKEVFNTSFL